MVNRKALVRRGEGSPGPWRGTAVQDPWLWGRLAQTAHRGEVLRPTRPASVATVQQHVLEGVPGPGIESGHIEGGAGHEAGGRGGPAQGAQVGSMLGGVLRAPMGGQERKGQSRGPRWKLVPRSG